MKQEINTYMKKNILQNLKFITFGLVLAAGVSAFAGTWAGPTASAPTNNVAVPVHTGLTQVKTTGTCVENNCGGLSVGTFSVLQNAEFDHNVFFKGMVRGGTPEQTDSQVNFGDNTHVVNVSVTGGASAVGALQSKGIANSSNSTLCASKNGIVTICGSAAATQESYTVPAQQLVYAMPDYAYTPGGEKYIPTICLSSTALRQLSFTISYTEDTGASKTANVTVKAGQLCSDRSSSEQGIVLSAPHTKVGDATNKCTYEGTDSTYQSPAYQGYAVTVDSSLRCH